MTSTAFAAAAPVAAPRALGAAPLASRRPSVSNLRRAPAPRRSNTPRMIARPENEPDAAVSATVQRLYDTYPFPPETLLDEAPIGYNWRWHHPSAYSFCTGRLPSNTATADKPLRILDAGCGTGESTSYLVHLNPGAQVTAIDLSDGALDVARERLQRSVPDEAHRCSFVHKSIFDVADLDGEFDHINCVGVIHHTPDPARALRALAGKLAPGGILHLFVYAAHGRWEIALMQKALRLLQKGGANAGSDGGEDDGGFEAGVKLGRQVFEALPDDNRLKMRENSRWAQENRKDATFADMYLHPQEVDYDVPSLFELIDDSGLDFVGFSNPRVWDISRVVGSDAELVARAQKLDSREQARLVELLDPETVTHFEVFLSKPPLARLDWETDEPAVRAATARMSQCVTGWPSSVLMDRDYVPVALSDAERAFVALAVEEDGVGVEDGMGRAGVDVEGVRGLLRNGIIVLDAQP